MSSNPPLHACNFIFSLRELSQFFSVPRRWDNEMFALPTSRKYLRQYVVAKLASSLNTSFGKCLQLGPKNFIKIHRISSFQLTFTYLFARAFNIFHLHRYFPSLKELFRLSCVRTDLCLERKTMNVAKRSNRVFLFSLRRVTVNRAKRSGSAAGGTSRVVLQRNVEESGRRPRRKTFLVIHPSSGTGRAKNVL